MRYRRENEIEEKKRERRKEKEKGKGKRKRKVGELIPQISHSDGWDSSDQEVKSVYATRATCGYQN